MSTVPRTPVDLNDLYYRLGTIEAQNVAIIRRLDEGSRRFAEITQQLDTLDDSLGKRVIVLEMARSEHEATAKDVAKLEATVDKLNIVEAKRTGIFVAVGAMCSLLGGAFALLAPHLFKKFGG